MRTARVILGVGALLFPLVVAVLRWVVGLNWVDALGLGFVLELLPALGMAQLPLIEEDPLPPRIPVYLASAMMILTLGGLAMVVGGRSGGVEALAMSPLPWTPFLTWSLALAAGGMGLIAIFREIGRIAGLRESPILLHLLPRTPEERWAFGGLSLAAGLGEEAVFRGYGLLTLATATGSPWVAALLTSLSFGVLHGFQGVLGTVRSGLLGLVFAWAVLTTGSLWPVVAAHAAVDIVAGAILGDVLVTPGEKPEPGPGGDDGR